MKESKPLDLDAIRARVNKASKGPWTCEGDKISGIMKIDSLRRVVGPAFFDSDGNDYCEVCEDIRHIGNAEFISNSRQDIPALCAEVESLRERVKELEGNWAALKGWLNRDKENGSGHKVSRALFLMAEIEDAMIKERTKG